MGKTRAVPSAFAALAALRDAVPAPTPTRWWLVATTERGARVGSIPVATHFQKIGPVGLQLPGVTAVLAIAEEGDHAIVRVDELPEHYYTKLRKDEAEPAIAEVDGRPLARGETRALAQGGELRIRSRTNATFTLRLVTEDPAIHAS